MPSRPRDPLGPLFGGVPENPVFAADVRAHARSLMKRYFGSGLKPPPPGPAHDPAAGRSLAQALDMLGDVPDPPPGSAAADRRAADDGRDHSIPEAVVGPWYAAPTGYWVTRDKQVYRIPDMDHRHLLNAYRKAREMLAGLRGGRAAAAEQKVEELRDELGRRGLLAEAERGGP